MNDLPFHRLSSQLAFLGPPLATGPLPALFYFSLSCQDSLLTDPFNQMPAYLTKFPLRIFSLTLPFHEPPLSPLKAIDSWIEEIVKGNNIISSFVDQVEEALFFLQKEGVLIPGKLAVSGLSRGAFIAAHAAARIPLFTTILGFAPLITLSSIIPNLIEESDLGLSQSHGDGRSHLACIPYTGDDTIDPSARTFASSRNRFFNQVRYNPHPLAKQLDLYHLIPQLTSRTLRFYIGNLDTRVQTPLCFSFVEKLAQAQQREGIRSPPIEMIITPSIGRDGHGTSKANFESGGKWILQQLGISHE